MKRIKTFLFGLALLAGFAAVPQQACAENGLEITSCKLLGAKYHILLDAGDGHRYYVLYYWQDNRYYMWHLYPDGSVKKIVY